LFLLSRGKKLERWELATSNNEPRVALLHRGFPSLALFHANAGVEQARISGAARGKVFQTHYRNASFTAITILKCVRSKGLNAEREGSFGCDIRHRFFASNGWSSQVCFHQVAQLQAGVGIWKTCRKAKQPTTNLKDALMHASRLSCTQLQRQVPRTLV
jgi:hypothetical protein